MNGEERELASVYDRESNSFFLAHTPMAVHEHMLFAICLNYRVLPPIDDMRWSDLRYWYGGIRGMLLKVTRKADR